MITKDKKCDAKQSDRDFLQVINEHIAISYFPRRKVYQIRLREHASSSGYLMPSRTINLDPDELANTENYEMFAKVLNMIACDIITIAKQKQLINDGRKEGES